MSQIYKQNNGGGGGFIDTIDGDTGFITGPIVKIFANQAIRNSGSTVDFVGNDATIMTFNVTDADGNTCIGNLAGVASFGEGSDNTALGLSALTAITGSVVGNTAIGALSLSALTGGEFNLALGYNTGINYTLGESSNISINASTTTLAGESNILRIGNGTGTGNQQLSKAFISGIVGNTVGSASMVTIDTATNQLGVATIPTGGIVTIDGDSGSITGSTVTIFANQASNSAGSSVGFVNSGTTSTFTILDANLNTIMGNGAGNQSITGSTNTGFGEGVLAALTTGSNNVAFGTSVMMNLTSGQDNAAIGYGCLGFITSGSSNVALGYEAGGNHTAADSSNINIGNIGTNGESNVIRIGTQGTSAGQQNKCFIAGINGATVTGTTVLCSTAGQLGTISSSARYKENIQDMAEDVSIMSLRPVEFNYKADKSRNKQYGLIAEDVDQSFPYLCFYGSDGSPESVKYHELPVLLLKEIQRLTKRIEALESR